MYEDAQKLIQSIVEHWAIEESVNFLKSGKISVKFHDEKKRINFNSLLDILELLEVYDEKKTK